MHVAFQFKFLAYDANDFDDVHLKIGTQVEDDRGHFTRPRDKIGAISLRGGDEIAFFPPVTGG